MKKIEKTEYGYINYQKKHRIFMTLCMAVLGLAIYFLGCALNHGENTNVFTVVAILMVLPGAKFFVSFVVLFPYHTPSLDAYEGLKEGLLEGQKLYSDVVITSPEKVMNLDFLLIEEGCIRGVLGKKGQDVPYIEGYLNRGVNCFGTNYQVKIYSEYADLLKSPPLKEKERVEKSELPQVEAYLKSLIV